MLTDDNNNNIVNLCGLIIATYSGGCIVYWLTISCSFAERVSEVGHILTKALLILI